MVNVLTGRDDCACISATTSRKVAPSVTERTLIVMMITAYGDGDNYSEAMKLGADDFLTKPVDFPALKEKLKTRIA